MKIVVKGKIKVPAGVNAKAACSGTVFLTIKKGKKLLSARNAKLSKSCSFSKTISLLQEQGRCCQEAGHHGALPGQLDPQADNEEPLGDRQALGSIGHFRRPARGHAGRHVRHQERDNHGHRRTSSDPSSAHLRADRARREGAQRAHPALQGDVRAGAGPPHRWRRVLVSAPRPLADLPRARLGAEGLGRRRQRDVGLPQRVRLDGPGPRAPGDRRGDPGALLAAARTSRRRPRTRSSSATSSRAAGACRSGGSRTPARSRRWTRSGSPAGRPAARRS